MNKNEVVLVMTCSACPEQYDAFDKNNNLIGYLRLRHGSFSVECPDVGGEFVYQGYPNGDGMFIGDERDFYLDSAKKAIAEYYSKQERPE